MELEIFDEDGEEFVAHRPSGMTCEQQELDFVLESESHTQSPKDFGQCEPEGFSRTTKIMCLLFCAVVSIIILSALFFTPKYEDSGKNYASYYSQIDNQENSITAINTTANETQITEQSIVSENDDDILSFLKSGHSMNPYVLSIIIISCICCCTICVAAIFRRTHKLVFNYSSFCLLAQCIHLLFVGHS